MLLGWSALEATIFSFTLMPTLSQVLADRAGTDGVPRATTMVLWCFLLLLVMGSFACVQPLAEAVGKREVKFIVPTARVGMFVMFFEVRFLYAEPADAVKHSMAMPR